MSNLSVNTITNAAGGNTAQINGMTPTAQSLQGFRNRLINGDMRIAQRGTSFANASNYTLDRWTYTAITTGVVTVSQQTDVPNNNQFQNSLRIAVTTADTSVAANDVNQITQFIEGFNISDLVGATFNMSFWVRSSKTGVHCIAMTNSGDDRTYISEYSIGTANTWEFKTIIVTGGLPSTGTWNFTNGVGLGVRFILAAGTDYHTTAGAWQTGVVRSTSSQVNCMDTIGNIFAITGVQLEAGSVATPFERRPYGTELALCQRYCINYRSAEANGPYYRYAYGECVVSTYLGLDIFFPVPMRVTPSLTTTGTAGNYCVYSRAAVTALSVVPTLGGDGASPYIGNINGTVGGGLTQGSAGALMSHNNNTSFLLFSAEL